MLSHVRTIRTLHPSSAEHYAAGLLPPRLPFPALSNLVLIPQPANLRASSSYLTRLAAKAAKESTARRRRRFSLLAHPSPTWFGPCLHLRRLQPLSICRSGGATFCLQLAVTRTNPGRGSQR